MPGARRPHLGRCGLTEKESIVATVAASEARPNVNDEARPTFRNVLLSLPADTEGDRSVDLAARLSRSHDASLTVVGIAPEPSRLQVMLQPPATLEAAKDQSLDMLASQFDRWRATVVDIDFDTVTCVTANPTEALLRLADDTEADLVVVSTDEGSGHDPSIKSLLRLCPSPVWVINPVVGRTNRILAAINPDPEEGDLNRSIINHALDLQTTLDGELYLLAAWELYGESSLRHSAFLRTPEEAIDQLVDAEQDEYRRLLDDLLRTVDLEGSNAAVHVVRGRPDEVIIEAVRHFGIDHLVVGTMARRGFSGWFFGNTAERLVDRAECSILAVKPPGFPSLA